MLDDIISLDLFSTARVGGETMSSQSERNRIMSSIEGHVNKAMMMMPSTEREIPGNTVSWTL